MASQLAKAAEELYFPASDESWESVAPASVGWDSEKLNAALDIAGARKSSGVVILHGGRIMAERYWDSPDASRRYSNAMKGRDAQGRAIEDVASAQKSVVAVIIGMAQEDDDGVSANSTGSPKASKPSADINWYNTFEADKQSMIDALNNGETNQGIIDSLKAQGLVINKKLTQELALLQSRVSKIEGDQK